MEAETGFLGQIREEIERSYRSREGRKLIEQTGTVQPASGELAELRAAIAALTASYALVGQTPPEPPTFRGRMGARVVKIVQRLLFWYTPQIVHFQYSALRAFESALRTFEGVRLIEREQQAALSTVMARTQVLDQRLTALRVQEIARMDREIARMDREITRIRAQQTVQEDRLTVAIQMRGESEEAAGVLPARRLRREDPHNMDSFYAALEDEFRGSREQIRERLSFYLPTLTEGGIGGESMPVLDVGCGRGEWLELLRENHLQATGIDLNRVLLAMCRERGLPVLEAEAVEYLQSLPEASLGAVTGFHILEHLPLPQLLDLLNEAKRVLKPGGVAIFETPNPNNVFVGSRYFYLDPTHRHPIPPLLGRFLAEARGFERVEILELHPWPKEHHVNTSTGGEIAARFNECFYGPQDYAIIGWKA